MAIDLAVPALSLVLAKVVDAGSGEAGRAAWVALTALVRKAFRCGSASLEPPRDETDAHQLAQELAQHAQEDLAFAAELRQWLHNTNAALSLASTTQVTNIMSGEAHGPVIQAGNITGTITFGSQAPDR